MYEVADVDMPVAQVEQLQQALIQLETRIAETRAKKELIVAKKNRAATRRRCWPASRC